MNLRFMAVLTVFILTFIFHLSVEQRDGLHSSLEISMGAHAEATLAPDAAPATMADSKSFPAVPLDDLDIHEHDEHDVIANQKVEALPAQVVRYELLAPKFHMQSVYYPLKRPPRS